MVGPNGAGKTTLLRLLAGIDAPERGTVALGPGDRVGYLPQEPPGPELTIDRLLGAALGEVWRLHNELERLEGLAWLEEFPAGFPGAVLVVAHDRRFLDAMVSQILELDGGELTVYEGGYTAYREEKRGARSGWRSTTRPSRSAAAGSTPHLGYPRLRAPHRADGAAGLAPKLKRYAKKVAKKAKARERRLQRELESDRNIQKPRHATPLKVELDGGGGWWPPCAA